MAEDKKTDKQSAKKTAEAKAKPASSAVKKEPVAKKTAAKTAAKGAAGSTASKTEEPVLKASKDALAAIEKAGASKDSDMKAAAKKISDMDKVAADNSIKSKKGVDELKARAHEAKQRAQRKILEESYVSDKPADPLERLANTFDSSARRWEMVVYPSMFAFVLLAGYGFFLIYRLTHDIAILSQSVTHMAVIVSDAMPRMTKDLNVMTGSIDNMTGNIDGMTTEITSMSGQMDSLTPMSHNIQSMTHNIGSMNRSVYGLQRDMHGMNRTVSSGPFGMMNDMMPFSSDTNVPPPIQPSPVWPSYNPVPQQQPFYRPYAAPAPVAPVAEKPKEPQQTVKTEVTMPGASPVSLKEVSSPKVSATVQDKGN
ncbi:MAG: hypothetical protein KJN89_00980 [Gammaproteobacteria bacterium]|nr:hypothetical protein [Gammaproteobacteria bacterium]MBT8134395.1 hypothetical protein [Gammaproteobacteria bacterium]NNJ48915.1 hypothetical protein [Gammaproteobacteria bacterium]